MTAQFASMIKTTHSRATELAYANRYFQSVVLILLSAVITTTTPSSTVAAESTADTRFNPDEAGFYALVAPCFDCHVIDRDATDPVGPPLKGVFGRRVASVDNYEYSAALYRKAAIGAVWDEASLDRFLESPPTMAPGNAMIYAGLPDPGDRALLIDWLTTGPIALDAEAITAASAKPSPQVSSVLQIDADSQYGEYLAGKCLTCHLAPGASGSIPPISGLPADYFINALLEYQQGTRSNPIMRTMSDLLNAKELAALADYFAKPEP
ncbi:MAG: hypothetical protein AB8B63_10225 [Granulosicoccus sp.]